MKAFMRINIEMHIILGLIFAAILGALVYLNWEGSQEGACTLEARLCFDGSAVGRTGPKCEFAACPETPVPNDWKFLEDERISFRYPEALKANFIQVHDWPPAVQILETPYSCTSAGSEMERAGRTEERLIGSKIFCVTEVLGAAAGSMYTQYAYAFSVGGKTAILTFSIRSPQCANYDEPNQSLCSAERDAFNIDGIVDQIAGSLEMK